MPHGELQGDHLLVEHGRARLSSPGAYNRVMCVLRAVRGLQVQRRVHAQLHRARRVRPAGGVHRLAKHPAEMGKAFRQTAVGTDFMSFGLTMTNWATIMIGNVDLIRLVLTTSRRTARRRQRRPCHHRPHLDGGPQPAAWRLAAHPPEAKNSFLHMLYYAFSGTTALHQASYVANLGAVEVPLEFAAALDSQALVSDDATDDVLRRRPVLIATALLDAGASLDRPTATASEQRTWRPSMATPARRAAQGMA